MTELFTTPVSKYDPNNGLPSGTYLEQFEAESLREKYIIRDFRWRNVEHPVRNMPLEQQRDEFIAEFGRLASKGIHIPHYFIIGIPKEGSQQPQVVATKIKPIPFEQADPGQLRNEAWQTVNGLSEYVEDTPIDGQFLYDPLKSRQFVYGVDEVDPEPHFYMVDLDGRTQTMTGYSQRQARSVVAGTAFDLGEAIGDPALQFMELAAAADA